MKKEMTTVAIGGLVAFLVAVTVTWASAEQEEQTSEKSWAALPMKCVALTAEDYQAYAECPQDTPLTLVEWCSGDCGTDDAKVRICCAPQ